MIYLDHQSTTPLDPAVREAMLPYLDAIFGNPHSAHRYGWEAEAAVEAARAQVAALLNCPPARVVFTSGATEASNWALKGVLTAPGQTRRRVVTIATEHSCVLETARYLESVGASLTVLGVGADGLVDLTDVAAAIDDDVAIVSAMLVNNEIGVIQPVAAIAELAHAAGALIHSDAAQGFGKLSCAVDALGVDLLSLSAHKLYGPKGVGALYVREGVALAPLLHGGGQEADGLRSGTLSPALCAGLGAAARIAGERMAADAAHVAALWDVALAALDVPHRINGSVEARWRGNLSVRFPGVDGARLLSDLRGVAVSSGAACAAAKGAPSHVLAALGLPEPLARATLRIGWGRFTTADDVAAGMRMIGDAVRAQAVKAA